MKVVEVLHMNGGIGDISYANNSLVQRKAILMTKPIMEQAMRDLYCSLFPENLCIADLGCSSGANTFLVILELVKTIEKERKKHGFQSPEFHYLFNDLPSNDFNTTFQSLGEFERDLRKQFGEGFGPCFFSGVCGSFYTRLFPSKSLHFVHSSYSIHWLSQVPNFIEKNKGNIYMSSTSPPSVIKAYYEQYEKDFSIFLKYRSEELMKGGKMVLTFLGRESEDPSSKEGCYIWELLGMALNELVIERNVILMTKPITEQAMSDLYCGFFPKNLCIADLGCSSGANTFLVISELVKTIEKERKKHGFQSPEFHYLFNDLPSNDFNTIFQSLGEFEHDLRKQFGEGFGPCYFSGVAGSFYSRLFPSKSLHFVHSSYSVHWPSQGVRSTNQLCTNIDVPSRVPDFIEKNKGNIYITSTSPPSYIKAYYKQFENDFSNFLKYRSKELMKGHLQPAIDRLELGDYRT